VQLSQAALVTGCSSGIGKAIALRAAGRDWSVYATARDPTAIADLRDRGCKTLALDVTDLDSIRAAVAEVEARHGAVGALINNAGYGQQGPFEETPLDSFRRQFETNVFGVVALCQQVLPGMRRQGGGRIVNVSSMGGRITFPGGSAYHGSKFALEAISDVLRFEVSGFGIRVIVIEPGPTTTGFGEASARSLDELVPTADGAYEELRGGIQAALASTFDGSPSVGASSPEEVADAVLAALEDPDPEPRVAVGSMAEELIARRERGSAREWDELVATMYPRPGGG